MSPYASYSEHLGELSRQKLLRVAGSSDTLRRAVLIHNIMRSTASLPSTPIATEEPQSDFEYAPYPPQQHHHDASQPQEDYDDSHSSGMAAESGGAAQASAAHQDLFLFPSMTSTPYDEDYAHSQQEQDWLDSILDDLDEVSVSVVEASDEDDEELTSTIEHPTPCHPHPSLFASGTPPPSPPLPASPCCIALPSSTSEDDYYDAVLDSPPTSPPDLLDSDGDDDSDEDDEFGEVVTPSSSTDFTHQDRFFLRHLPFRHHSQPSDCFQPLP